MGYTCKLTKGIIQIDSIDYIGEDLENRNKYIIIISGRKMNISKQDYEEITSKVFNIK